jgi:hypothetical protein
MKTELFFANENLLSVNDVTGCIIELENDVFNANKSSSNIISINLPSVTIAGDGDFVRCVLLTELNLPQLITAGRDCFQNCELLPSIDLPSLTTAGVYCFVDCNSLTSIDLSLLTSVGDYFFAGCDNLSDVNLPQVTNIGDECFSSSDSLETINLPLCEFLGSSVGDNNVFNGIFGNTITITIPSLLMTCNGGNPDGDIIELQSNNTVTIITT